MKKFITNKINKCEICQTNKYNRNQTPIKFEITETPKKPLEIIHMDIYFVNKTSFLTIIDKFSKFGAAYLINIQNSKEVITHLKHFISHHGIPKKIISDRGTEFTSLLFKEFCKAYKIELHFS